MERPKKSKLQDKDMSDRLEHIYKNALGNPVVLDNAPGQPGDMKSNTIAVNGTDVYIRTASGTLLKLTGTEITGD